MAGRKAKTATAAKSAANKTTRKSTRKTTVARSKTSAKTAASKASSKKVSAKKAAAKSAPKKPAPKKTAPKKTAGKKAGVKKAATKRAPVQKTAAKKPAAKKTKTGPKQSGAKTPRAKTSRAKTAGSAVGRAEAAARRVKKVAPQKLSAFDAKVLAELDDLARVIRDAKREIAAIRPDEVKEEYLPKAADELDAVIAATADATDTIMDACEVVEGVMGDVTSAVSAKLMDATTQIYEACTFQDITGQRITKVVTTMKHIEERIDALMAAFGGAAKPKKKAPAKSSQAAKDKKTEVTDADLLEGPQLGDNAKSQAEIDDLLASFD